MKNNGESKQYFEWTVVWKMSESGILDENGCFIVGRYLGSYLDDVEKAPAEHIFDCLFLTCDSKEYFIQIEATDGPMEVPYIASALKAHTYVIMEEIFFPNLSLMMRDFGEGLDPEAEELDIKLIERFYGHPFEEGSYDYQHLPDKYKLDTLTMAVVNNDKFFYVSARIHREEGKPFLDDIWTDVSDVTDRHGGSIFGIIREANHIAGSKELTEEATKRLESLRERGLFKKIRPIAEELADYCQKCPRCGEDIMGSAELVTTKLADKHGEVKLVSEIHFNICVCGEFRAIYHSKWGKHVGELIPDFDPKFIREYGTCGCTPGPDQELTIEGMKLPKWAQGYYTL